MTPIDAYTATGENPRENKFWQALWQRHHSRESKCRRTSYSDLNL